ncbi:efflux RND transporter permease subunit [Niabella sp. CJ426]|uniref:efflux RND transporter permease subunit n=1 Tax=Niabella sp. CJ426 TaxID=3393740 RepID=UPI003D034BA2
MIADVFIKRPVTAIVVSIVIVLVGIISMLTLPVAQYPDISPPTVQIAGNFTGADAQTVEQTTTTAMETQINGTPGMTYMTSNSTSSGQSSITVNFQVGTDINIATLDVQNRVSVAEPTLPDAVKRLGLTVRKRNPSIMMALAFYSPNGTHDATFIGNYVNLYVKDALARVKGVGDIFSRADDFSMRVWLNPSKMAALGVAPAEINAALQEQNLQAAAGTIGGNPQSGEQVFEYSLLTNSRINTPEQFENIVVRTRPTDGSIIYLKDVARIELGKFDYTANAFVSGKPAAFLLIYQAPGANALDTYKGINEALERLRPTFPKDIDFKVPLETATVVQVSINEVMHTLVEALILVVLVVYLFLQNWRATLIPVLAIPVSLIGTFIFFNLLGFTINTLTLFAFVLAIGIVVDDAIVVVEAIQHNIDSRGMSPKDATIKAMKEISAPVIAIALILAAVFIPVGFIPGIVGRLYQQFAITIAVSVLLSAFVALSLTPALSMLMLKPTAASGDRKKNVLDRFFDRFNNWFNKVTLGYTKSVGKWIRKTPYVVTLLIVVIAAMIFLFKTKSTGFIPTEDEGRMFVTYELPEGTSTTRSIAMIKDIMKRVEALPEVDVVGGLAGLNIISFSNKSNVGTMFVKLKKWDDRKGSEHDVNAVIGKIIGSTKDIKEARVMPIAPPAIPGLGQTAGFTFQLQQTGSTDDVNKFEAVANKFLQTVNAQPAIGRAYTFFNARTPSYQVNVDKELAKKMGVNVAEVYTTLSNFLGSSYVNDFNIYGRNFRVMTQADYTYRGSLDNLKDYYVRNSLGNMVPLNMLVTTKLIEAPAVVSHYNIYRSVEINGSPKDGFSSGEAIEALREAAKTLPAGYGYEFSGMSREEIAAGDQQTTIFAISIVFVFLFLAALYESWSVPFSVLLAVPIGAFGSILALTLLPKLSNNVYAQIGLITLIGLAAKNAILIVEFAKERVDKGMDVVQATLQSVRLRLRPIIMTSLAFILGVVPLMIATGAASVSRRTIGWTVFGGMLAATSLAIFIVPVLYVLITKMAYRKKRKTA